MKKRDKTILIIAIIVVVAVALYFIIPKFTGEAIGSSCADSDGGKNYHVQGTAQISADVKGTDYCYSENQLREYSCSDRGTLDIEVYDCVGGCEDGACIQQEQGQTSELSAEKSWLNNVWLWAGVIVVILVIFVIIKKRKK